MSEPRNEHPTVREYLEQRLDYERSLVAARFEAVDAARKLQAIEYERRLDNLNGEATRLRVMQESYVPREVFERYKESNDARAHAYGDGVEKRLKDLETLNANVAGRQAVWGLLVIVGAAILSGVAQWVLTRGAP